MYINIVAASSRKEMNLRVQFFFSYVYIYICICWAMPIFSKNKYLYIVLKKCALGLGPGYHEISRRVQFPASPHLRKETS